MLEKGANQVQHQTRTVHVPTGTSPVGAISKAQIKSKEGPFIDKKTKRKKSHSAKKTERGRDLYTYPVL